MAETAVRCDTCGCAFQATVSPLMPPRICPGCLSGRLAVGSCTCQPRGGSPGDSCWKCGKPVR